MIQRLREVFERYRTFSVTSHMNVEGDALGSQMAVYALLKKMKKKVCMVNQDAVPPSYSFLPFSRFVRNTPPASPVQVAVVVDCSDLFRTGRISGYIAKAGMIVNIDHHISNSYFGRINWVDSKASSTCEMLYRLCARAHCLDTRIAACLYTGMLTDTGSFSFSNTTPRVHTVVSELLTYDISPQKIYQALHSAYAFQDIRFVGRLISRLQQDAAGRIAWLSTSSWPRALNVDLTATVFSVMRLLKQAEVLVLFKEMGKNRVRVNFRSKGSFDVNKAARAFGGGGHTTASGTTVVGKLRTVEKEVISYIRKRMK